jgi:hypothetical protein
MNIQLDQKYLDSKNSYHFPSDEMSQNDKDDKTYFLNCANAIVSRFIHGRTSIPYNYSGSDTADSIENLRNYLRGKNKPEKYKSKLLANKKNGNSGMIENNLDISWRVPQVLAEKMDVVKGYMMKLVYDVQTQAIDMQSKMSKEMIEANLKLMIDDRFKLLGDEINEAAGRNVINQENQSQEIPFQSEKDISMFSQIGGIILEQEVAIKTLLLESLLVSDWEGSGEKIIEDILAVGMTGTKCYVNAGSDIPLARWVDINRAIIPHSDYNDYRDITYGGELPQISIAQLRKESDLTEAQLIEIARKYSKTEKTSSSMGDGFYYQASLGYTNDGMGMNLIDSLIVDVADVVWIGTHNDTYTKVNRKKEGNLAMNKVSSDYQLTNNAEKNGKKIEKYGRQCVYKAKLIVGTDYVFDYGKEFNMAYRKNDKGNQEIILPYRFFKTGSTSLVERCIGFYDDIAIATYKKRNALKKIIPPPGIYMEQSAFENINVGNQKLSPMQNMHNLTQKGVIVGNRQNVWGTNNVGARPLEDIPTGSLQQIQIFNQEIEFNIREIERVTGINQIFAGATPDSSQGLGVSKIAVNATTNALYPVIRVFETCKTHTLRVLAKQCQVSADNAVFDEKNPKPHDSALKKIKVGSGLSFNEFMIKIEAGASDDDKQMLMQDIRDLQNMRRSTGSGGIRHSDYILLYQIIKGGNLDQARLALSQIEDYVAKLDEAKQSKLVEQNQQSQMQSNQQTSQNEQQTLQMEEKFKGEREMQLQNDKIQGEIQLEQIKGANAMKLAAIQNIYGAKDKVK